MKSFVELKKDFTGTDDWVDYSIEHKDEIQEMIDLYLMSYGFDEVNTDVYIDDYGIEVHLVDEIFYQVYVNGEDKDFQGWDAFYEILPKIINERMAQEYIPSLIKLSEDFVKLYEKTGVLDIDSKGSIQMNSYYFKKLFDEFIVEDRDKDDYPFRLVHWEEGVKFYCITEEVQ